MKITTCDCCGKQIDTFFGNGVSLNDRAMKSTSKTKIFDDVCDECYDKIWDFIQNLGKDKK